MVAPTGLCRGCGTDAILDAEEICVDCFFREWREDNPAGSFKDDDK